MSECDVCLSAGSYCRCQLDDVQLNPTVALVCSTEWHMNTWYKEDCLRLWQDPRAQKMKIGVFLKQQNRSTLKRSALARTGCRILMRYWPLQICLDLFSAGLQNKDTTRILSTEQLASDAYLRGSWKREYPLGRSRLSVSSALQPLILATLRHSLLNQYIDITRDTCPLFFQRGRLEASDLTVISTRDMNSPKLGERGCGSQFSSLQSTVVSRPEQVLHLHTRYSERYLGYIRYIPYQCIISYYSVDMTKKGRRYTAPRGF